ncbi:MAG: O-methyltransferase [Croceivirga sp.]
MLHGQILKVPQTYTKLAQKSEDIGFDMPSDIQMGSLLKTLVASKPKGRFLELGTGMGLSLSWMVDGLDDDSTVISLDNDPKLVKLVKPYFEKDARVEIRCEDGGNWLNNYEGESFDLIFADAWPGKYSHLDEVLKLIPNGGFYIIDDMNPQPNWPDGHEAKAEALVKDLEERNDLILTQINWSTGVIIAIKK